MYSMKEGSVQSSRTLGQTAAEDAEVALEKMAVEHLQSVAIEKAAHIEKRFLSVEACIQGMVDQTQDIYKYPEKYPDRTVPLPEQGVMELTAQLLWSEKLNVDNARENAMSELLKLGNIQDLLIQYNAHNDMISSAYVATESGWMIQADYIAFSKYEEDELIPYEASERSWYQMASQTGPGEIIYTDVMWDVHEGGECIVCASPVYCNDELVAVAGIGFYLELIKNSVQTTTIGEEGYAFLINEKGQIITSGKNTDEIIAYMEQGIDLRKCNNQALAETVADMMDGKSTSSRIYMDGKEVYLAYAPLERLGWSFVTVMDVNEVIAPAKESQNAILDLTENTAMELDGTIRQMQLFFIVLLLIIFGFICLSSTIFTKILTTPIKNLAGEVAKIDGGNLDYRIHINSGDEVEELGQAFNHMTAKIQSYIDNLANVTAEKERIRTEIQVAAQLQADMLPKVEEDYAKRKEFTIAASMTPAKGVGGDFYDFFFIDDDHLGLIMADVSGKGVPAALFMVVSRTLIRSNMLKGLPLEQVVMDINDNLCANNKNGMFVTAWIGILTVSTGKIDFVNAGHCRPLIRRWNGECCYNTDLSGLVLAGIEGVPYVQSQIQMQEGDVLLLYTDGVTEATSVENKLYGEERLKKICENMTDNSPQTLLEMVWEDVDDFQKGGEQFDDITMLAVTYHGDGFIKRNGKPEISELQKYIFFTEKYLKEQKISWENIGKIRVAVDEIFSNICYYSNASECTMGIRTEGEKVVFYFEDNGIPFNPLMHPEPDTKAALEHRQIGGLGIYIVKKQMDLVEYEYLNKKNRLICYIKERGRTNNGYE